MYIGAQTTPSRHVTTAAYTIAGLGQAGQEIQYVIFKRYREILNLLTLHEVKKRNLDKTHFIANPNCFEETYTEIEIDEKLLSTQSSGSLSMKAFLNEISRKPATSQRQTHKKIKVKIKDITCQPIVSDPQNTPLIKMIRADTDDVTLDILTKMYLRSGLPFPPSITFANLAGIHGIRQQSRKIYNKLKEYEKEDEEKDIIRTILCVLGCHRINSINTSKMTLPRDARSQLEIMAKTLEAKENIAVKLEHLYNMPCCLRAMINPLSSWDIGDSDRMFLIHSLSGSGAGIALWILDDHEVDEECSIVYPVDTGSAVRDIVQLAIAPAIVEAKIFNTIPDSVRFTLGKLFDIRENLRGFRHTFITVDLDVAMAYALLSVEAKNANDPREFIGTVMSKHHDWLRALVNAENTRELANVLQGRYDKAYEKGVRPSHADIYIADSIYPFIALGLGGVYLLGSKRMDFSEADFLGGLLIPSYMPGHIAIRYIDYARKTSEVGGSDELEAALALLALHGALSPLPRKHWSKVSKVVLVLSRGLVSYIVDKFGRGYNLGTLQEMIKQVFPNSRAIVVEVSLLPGAPRDFEYAFWAYLAVDSPEDYVSILYEKYR